MPAPATQPHRDPALDGLRGFAVLLVFVFHFGGGLRSSNPILHALGLLTEAGWIGVVLFFALSGFLITGSLWNAHQQPRLLPNFYARRALRILPLYYFVLLLVTLAALAHGATFAELRPLALFVVFLQNLPVLATRALINPSPYPLYHLWSLAVEEQFYLLWPALLLLTARRATSPRATALRLCLALFVLVLLYLAIVYGLPWAFALGGRANPLPDPHLFDYFLLTHAGALLLGSALALRLRSPDPASVHRLHRRAGAAFLLGLALYLLSSLCSGTFYLTPPLQFMLGLPAISLAAAALIPIALRPGLPRSLLSLAPLRFVGRISYGVYIYQLLLQPFIHRLTLRLIPAGHGDLYFVTRFTVAFLLTLLTAWLSFHLLERPFLRLKRHFPLHP